MMTTMLLRCTRGFHSNNSLDGPPIFIIPSRCDRRTDSDTIDLSPSRKTPPPTSQTTGSHKPWTKNAWPVSNVMSTDSLFVLEIESHFRVDRIAKGRLQRFSERCRTHNEYPRPVYDLKDLRSHQRLKLLDCKRGILVEEGIGLQHGSEHIVGNFLYAGLRAGGLLHRADQVDIVDSLLYRNVIGTSDFALKGRGNYGGEVAGIQRLTKIAAVTWNRKHRSFLHETSQPADVFSIKPAEHQRGPQDDLFDATGGNQGLLRLLGLGVVIYRH